MQFALLIYETPEAFASRKSDGTDPYTGAWRAYHKALAESGVFVAGDPLEVPETGTTIRIKEGKRGACRTVHMLTPKNSWEGSPSWSCHRLTQPWSGQRAARLPRPVLSRCVCSLRKPSAGSRDERK